MTNKPLCVYATVGRRTRVKGGREMGTDWMADLTAREAEWEANELRKEGNRALRRAAYALVAVVAVIGLIWGFLTLAGVE